MFDGHEGRVSAKEKLTALNGEGYKIWICIDKLNSGKTPDSFSKYNPYTVENIKTFLRKNNCKAELLSTKYINSQSKLNWRCDLGHVFEMAWSEFKQGKRCAKCSGVYKRTNAEFLQEVLILVGNEYSFLGKFEHVDKKIEVIHNKCNYKYEVTPYKFINREQRCPKCNDSKGEKRIEKYLESKNLSYISEYRFLDCKNIYPLRFDFAVLDEQNKPSLLIEYDGKQHFRPYKYYGGEKEFELVRKRDAIKNNYCKTNNIKLIRIPYTKYHEIEDILATHL